MSMGENNKQAKYALLYQQVSALIEGETDRVAIMANVVAAIHETMGFFWTGFYRVVQQPEKSELLLGPFQGPVACMHIGYGRGVCGTAWKEGKTSHIACSSLSRSEIVVPLFDAQGTVVAVLDIDSKALNTFDDTDREGLEKILTLL